MERKTADRIAGVVFVAALIGALILIFTARLPSFPTTTTTTKSTVVTVRGPQGVSQRTDTSEKTVTDVVPSFWQDLAGSRTPIVFFCAASLLIAFLLAAVVQRVLLGEYSFSFGPLTVPNITGKDLKKDTGPALAVIPNSDQFRKAATSSDTPEPEWVTETDPNLALAGCRLDIEKEIRRIAKEHEIPSADSAAVKTLITSLGENNIIEPGTAPGLRGLVDLGNRAAHGAAVDESSIEVLRTDGRAILAYLASVNN